jgi:peroxiredoxin
VDGSITKLSLADYQDKFLVLVFYPLDFTFGTPLVYFGESGSVSDGIARIQRPRGRVQGARCGRRRHLCGQRTLSLGMDVCPLLLLLTCVCRKLAR